MLRETLRSYFYGRSANCTPAAPVLERIILTLTLDFFHRIRLLVWLSLTQAFSLGYPLPSF